MIKMCVVQSIHMTRLCHFGHLNFFRILMNTEQLTQIFLSTITSRPVFTLRYMREDVLYILCEQHCLLIMLLHYIFYKYQL